MKKRRFSLFLLCLIVCLMMVPAALAAQDVRTGTPSSSTVSGGAVSVDEQVGGVVSGILDDTIPDVTTEDVVNRLERKGNDVVWILQTVGKYVCIGAFCVCCLLALIGLIGNKRVLAGGILGAILSGVAYAGIVCGREIVNGVAMWAAS